MIYKSKNMMRRFNLELIVCFLLITTKGFSYGFKVNGLCYNRLSDSTVELTWEALNTPYTGDIVVPSYVNHNGTKYEVVSIGDYAMVNLLSLNDKEGVVAWLDNSKITSVSLPSTILSIGDYAFSYCGGLTSISIPNSVTSIGHSAFSNCSGLTSITIPNSVRSIGSSTFEGCSSLTSITIPNSVTSIGNLAFRNCSGLTSVTIPSSVTRIGDSAFSLCSSLTSITIPNSVTSIGSWAFYGCSGLTFVTIPSSVTRIGDLAFSCCSGLTSVVSEIVKPFTISNNVFSDYSKPTLTVPSGTKSAYQSTAGWNKFTNIVEASEDNTSTKRTIHVATAGTLPNLISESEKYNIEELTLTGELNGTDFRLLRDMAGNNYKGEKTAGKLTVLDLSGAKIVAGGDKYLDTNSGTFSYTVDKNDILPQHVFRGCKFISITIPSSVTNIGNSAFFNCIALTSIIIPNSVTSIASRAFQYCSGLTSITIPNSVTSIGDSVFYHCSGLTSITIPNSVTSIGESAFEDCSGLTYIIIPNSVTSIGVGAFSHSKGLTSITLSNSLTSIGNGWFQSCSGLTSITIPNSVTSIGYAAFSNCSGLTSITIPSSVTRIDNLAFKNCSSLTSIVSEIVKPFAISENVFSNYSKPTLTVPSGTRSAYQTTDGWKKFTNIVEAAEDNPSTKRTIHVATAGTLPNLISESEKYNIEELTLTGELNGTDFRLLRDMARGGISFSYDYDMFYDTSNGKLTYLDISGAKIVSGGDAYIEYYDKGQGMNYGEPLYYYLNTPDIIPIWLFWNCKLTSVILPNSLVSIGPAAFSECINLTSIIIPNDVTSIGYDAFSGCTGLTTITLPKSVTTIGERAFNNCISLTSITIPNSVISIGERVLQNCSGLMSINVEIENKMYDSRNGCNAIIETASNKLITGCKNTNIPNTVLSIGDYAFYECSSISSVSIPNSVTTIGEYSFSYCRDLSSITIPNSVTSIGNFAFEGCNALKSVYSLIEVPFKISSSTFSTYDEATLYVPKGTKQNYLTTRYWFRFSKIDDGIEYNYDKVREVFVSTAGTLSNYISESEKYYIEELTLKGELNGADFRLLREMAGNNDLGLETGGRLWFLDMSEARIVHGGGNYLNSGTISSYNNGIISTWKLHTSIEQDDELSDLIFAGCSSLKEVILPQSIISIGNSSFWACFNLVSIVIPNSVISISSDAFYRCSSLTSIISEIVKPFEIQNDVFSDYSKPTLMVPYGTKTAYQSTAGWKNFKNIVEAVTVTAKSYTLEYGDANPTFEYTVSGGSISGTPKITCSATKTSSVGTYTIMIEKGSVTNSNVIFVDGTLTITKAPLTITAKSYTRKQGESNPTFDVTYSGFKNGENSSVLSKQPTCITTAVSSSPPGTYDIIASGASATNYDISYVNGVLTVTQADAVIVTAKSYTREYGEENPVFDYTTSGGTLNGTPTIICSATRTSPVGTYPIRITQGSERNYNVTYVDGMLTITKAPLIITAKSYKREEGTANPTFEATYSGFKNDETESVLSKKPTLTTTATIDSKPGDYPITASGAEARNYQISYMSGKLTVTEKNEVMFTSQGISYIGTNATRTAEIEVVASDITELEIPQSVVNDGKTYQVTSVSNGALSNRKFNYVSLPSTITSLNANTFYNSVLGALIWKADASLSSNMFSYMAMPTLSNFLLYVNSKSYAPSNVTNVVVGNTASNIVLADGTNTWFYCPMAFTAQSVTYTHHYGMLTGGNGKGWETISLPYDVQKIEHKSKGVLTPFVLYNDMMTQRPFWLYEFGSNGFSKTDVIKANTPYIIAMPNDSKYDEEYILVGDVTFSATNAQIHKTESLVMPSSNGKTFVPAFTVVDSSSSVYALNVNNNMASYAGSYDAGSRFISNLRDVYPFEAYMTTLSSSARTLGIDFADGTTGIDEIPMAGNGERVKVYSLSGLLLIDSEQSEWESLWQQLPSGVYIVNGKKTIK